MADVSRGTHFETALLVMMPAADPFDVTCTRTGWFGDSVVFLRPDDPAP
jgi:hypothetical protein